MLSGHRYAYLYSGFFSFALVVLASPQSHAHTQGVSVASVSVAKDGSARLELGLATAEVSRLVPIDRDRDGQVSDAELALVRESLAKILPGTFDVVADGKRCSAKLDAAKLAEPTDGVDLVLLYHCAPNPQDITFRSHLAPAMAPGHRLVATISSPSRTQSRVLGSSEPECALHTEWEQTTRESARLQYGIAGGITLAIGLGYALTRRKKPTS